MRCPIIAASTPPSLRAQRSNPGATVRGLWIASSQGLLAMTANRVIRVPQAGRVRLIFLKQGLGIVEDDRAVEVAEVQPRGVAHDLGVKGRFAVDEPGVKAELFPIE